MNALFEAARLWVARRAEINSGNTLAPDAKPLTYKLLGEVDITLS